MAIRHVISLVLKGSAADQLCHTLRQPHPEVSRANVKAATLTAKRCSRATVSAVKHRPGKVRMAITHVSSLVLKGIAAN